MSLQIKLWTVSVGIKVHQCKSKQFLFQLKMNCSSVRWHQFKPVTNVPFIYVHLALNFVSSLNRFWHCFFFFFLVFRAALSLESISALNLVSGTMQFFYSFSCSEAKISEFTEKLVYTSYSPPPIAFESDNLMDQVPTISKVTHVQV